MRNEKKIAVFIIYKYHHFDIKLKNGTDSKIYKVTQGGKIPKKGQIFSK